MASTPRSSRCRRREETPRGAQIRRAQANTRHGDNKEQDSQSVHVRGKNEKKAAAADTARPEDGAVGPRSTALLERGAMTTVPHCWKSRMDNLVDVSRDGLHNKECEREALHRPRRRSLPRPSIRLCCVSSFCVRVHLALFYSAITREQAQIRSVPR